MKYLLFFITTSVFANYVTGPTATVVYSDLKVCEEKEGTKCFPKPDDHTITKIEDGKLVVDTAKAQEKARLEAEKKALEDSKKSACEIAKAAFINVKKDEEGLVAFQYIRDCLL